MKTSNSHFYEYENLKSTKPLLAFEGGMDLAAWKKEAKTKLAELLGLPLNECEPKLTIESTEERENCINYRFTVETEPGYLVPCHLLVPKGVKKAPLTICLSGHGNGMHIVIGVAKTESDEKTMASWKHRVMGPRSIEEGRCALVVEARNFGETSLQGYGNTCTEAAKIAIIMGRTVIGERVWDVMKTLDAVEKQFDCVDMTDIVCTGNSGGGTATYYLAAMDERITAAAPSCSICSYEGSIAAMPHCLCNHIPGIRKYFEMEDLAGLIAPRKLVIAAGTEDKIFPIDATKKSFEKIKLIYKAAGAEDNCALEAVEGGHLNYADNLWKKLHALGV